MRKPIRPRAFIKWAQKEWKNLPPELTTAFHDEFDDDERDVNLNTLHKFYTIILAVAKTNFGFDPTKSLSEKQPNVFSNFENYVRDAKVGATVSAKKLREYTRDAQKWAASSDRIRIKEAPGSKPK